MDESIVKKYGEKAKAELLSIFDAYLKASYAAEELRKTEDYYEGLQQLWDCFKAYAKMVQMDKFNAVGYGTFEELLDKITPTWFVGKMKEYEEQKKAEEEIKVGNEVYDKSGNVGTVIHVLSDNKILVAFLDKKYNLIKVDKWETSNAKTTGRHFDIEGILKEMREGLR